LLERAKEFSFALHTLIADGFAANSDINPPPVTKQETKELDAFAESQDVNRDERRALICSK
jgi:hypothetical protein